VAPDRQVAVSDRRHLQPQAGGGQLAGDLGRGEGGAQGGQKIVAQDAGLEVENVPDQQGQLRLIHDHVMPHFP